MARPIKETPILKGKDAKRFAAKIEENKRLAAPREEYDRVMANYRKLAAQKPRD